MAVQFIEIGAPDTVTKTGDDATITWEDIGLLIDSDLRDDSSNDLYIRELTLVPTVGTNNSQVIFTETPDSDLSGSTVDYADMNSDWESSDTCITLVQVKNPGTVFATVSAPTGGNGSASPYSWSGTAADGAAVATLLSNHSTGDTYLLILDDGQEDILVSDIFIDSLTELAVGANLTIGTAATPSHFLNFQSAILNRELQRMTFAGIRGRPTLERTLYAPQKVQDRSTLAISGMVDMRDIILPFLCSMDGSPTVATPSGATNARTVTFSPAINSHPAIRYATFERRSSDADETKSRRAYRNSKGFCTGVNFTSQDGFAQCTSNWQLGEETASSTVTSITGTAAQPIILPVREMTMGIYDSWATAIAATPSSGDAYDYAIAYTSGHSIRERNDGAIDYTLEDGAEGRMLDFTATLYATSGSSDIMITEEGKLLDTRYVKIRMKSSSNIETGFPYYLEFVMACTHADDSLVEKDGVGDDGRNTRTLHLMSGGDTSNGMWIRAQVHDSDQDVYL